MIRTGSMPIHNKSSPVLVELKKHKNEIILVSQ